MHAESEQYHIICDEECFFELFHPAWLSRGFACPGSG
jgi:hypothetical protein